MKRRLFMTGIILAVLVAGSNQAMAQDEMALTTQYDAARQTRNWPLAESLAQQLIAMHQQNWADYRRLAEAQAGAGKYPDALASFQVAITLAAFSSFSKARDASGEMLVTKGNLYLQLNKVSEALDAYTEAAPLSENPGIAYFNICTLARNNGLSERAARLRPGHRGRPKQGRRLFPEGIAAVRQWRGQAERQTQRTEGNGRCAGEISCPRTGRRSCRGSQADAPVDRVALGWASPNPVLSAHGI